MYSEDDPEREFDGATNEPETKIISNKSVEDILSQLVQTKVSIKDVAAAAQGISKENIKFTSVREIMEELAAREKLMEELRVLQEQNRKRVAMENELDSKRREQLEKDLMQSNNKESTGLTIARGVTKSLVAGVTTFGILSILKRK